MFWELSWPRPVLFFFLQVKDRTHQRAGPWADLRGSLSNLEGQKQSGVKGACIAPLLSNPAVTGHTEPTVTFILANRSDKDKETSVPPFSGWAFQAHVATWGLTQVVEVWGSNSQSASTRASWITAYMPQSLWRPYSRRLWQAGADGPEGQQMLLPSSFSEASLPAGPLPFPPASPMCHGARAGASCSPSCSSLHSFPSDWQTYDRTTSGHLMPSVRL